MSKSILFKKAHAMARKTIKRGDSYQVTFSLCLKQVIDEADTVHYTHITTNSFDGAEVTTKGYYKVYSYHSNTDKLQMIIAALSIVIIFALTLQAIQLY